MTNILKVNKHTNENLDEHQKDRMTKHSSSFHLQGNILLPEHYQKMLLDICKGNRGGCTF